MVTTHPEIFKLFNIPLHYKVQGNDCISKAVKKYLKLFDKKLLVNGQKQNFRDYLHNTKYELNMSFDQFRQSLFATTLLSVWSSI